MRLTRKFPRRLLGATLLATAIMAVHAQDNPNRPIRMIVPFTTGGGVDIVARAIAQRMSEGLGQSVIIDNRAGAGGNIGIELAARAAPDGYTILIASNAMTISPSIYKSLAYDPVTDFTPIGMTSSQD